MRLLLLHAAALSVLAGFVVSAHAATYTATTVAELQSLADGLQPGDTLLVAPGTYTVRTWRLRDIRGTPGQWIEIRPEGGPVVIQGDQNQNVVNVDDVGYVLFEGFEITYVGGSSDIDGLKFNAGTNSDHVILKDLHVHDVTGVAINSKAGELSFLDVTRCHLHDTAGTGEGMYLGCNGGTCWIRDSTIRGNWVHDTGGSQGDGIELKQGSYRNVVEDNVVHATNGWSAITLYRTYRGDPADNNLVRRNVVWQAGEGIFTAAETTIVNNVVFDSTYGINLNNHGNEGVSDLHLLHNTVYSCADTGMRLGSWDVGTGDMVFLNNAAYQDDAGSRAFRAPQGLGGAVVDGNRHHGTSELGAGSTPGLTPGSEFVSADVMPGAVDLRPAGRSTLADMAVPNVHAPGDDFNESSRPLGPGGDVGAYELGSAGWQVDAGFKPLAEDAGPFPVTDMRIAKTAADQVRLTWDTSACRSWNYHLFFGLLDDVASHAVTGQECYLFNRGWHDRALPGGGPDLWFVIAGTDGAGTEGSHGLDSFGMERPSVGSGRCSIAVKNAQGCP